MRKVMWICAALLACMPSTASGDESAMPLGTLESLARPQAYRACRVSSAKKDLTQNMDRASIEPGAVAVLAELDGPGAITHFWCFANTKDPFFGRTLVLRIYWDGADRPSIEAPLGDFFAVAHGAQAEVDSALVSVTAFGRSRNCFWHMPFRKHARITVTNESEDIRMDGFWYLLDWRKCDEDLPEDTPIFTHNIARPIPAIRRLHHS